MDFIRPDANATCDPKHLALQISTAIAQTVTCDINKEKVIVYEDVTGKESQVQAVIDSYVYDPEATLPDKTWRAKLQDEIIFFETELASWPASPSAAYIAAAVKRLARNQLRIMRFIRDNTKDDNP